MKKSIKISMALILAIAVIDTQHVLIPRECIKDKITFFSEFIKNPTGVGAIAPSSQALAIAISKNIPIMRLAENRPLRILEVGAGTGVFTEAIKNQMMTNDTLDVIEIEPHFCLALKEKFKDQNNIVVHEISILDWNHDQPYDIIISGLPFNAFESDFVCNVLDHYKKLIRPGGYLSFFEYAFLPKIKKLLLLGNQKQALDFKKTRAHIAAMRDMYEVDAELVIKNVPPAWVYHLQIGTPHQHQNIA